VRQGKIRSFGVSNHFAFDLCELLWIADKYGWPKPVSSQIPYSRLKRNFNIDLEFCEKHNIAVTPYQILQGGLLTGKYKRGQDVPEGTRMKENPNWLPQPNDTIYDQLEATQALADEVGVPFSQYTVAWTLTQQAMTSMVIGSTKLHQIEDAVSGSEVAIPKEILEKQEAITPAPTRHTAPFSRPTESYLGFLIKRALPRSLRRHIYNREAIMRLPHDLKTTLLLYQYQGLSYKKIS